MTYPGNSSLPNEVKDRVLSTFEQTLSLFRQGRMDEVSAGCDLLLKMDPMFGPARQLLEKSQNPMAPIDIDELMPAQPAANDTISQAREALSRRDFQRALDLSTSILSNDFGNEAAQSIATEAQERLEAAPFVQQFVKTARTHLASGNLQGAKTALEKARTLDDMHPAIIEVQKAIEAASAPAAPSPQQTGFGPTSGFGAPSWQSAQPDAKPSFDFSDAFVVDSAPAAPSSSPGATPATDFGFTFEEEAKPAPQDSPVNFATAFGSSSTAAEPPAGEASTFDFSMASVDVSPEDQARITTFLAEGDEAYASNDYQKAIDIWSRIFLIDVTNEQASERIERARKKRMEIDERIDESIVAATHAFERKEFDTARRQFEEVLTYDPDNQVALDYLGRLDSSATAEAAPVIAPTPSKPLSPDLFEEDDYTGADAEILRPPAPEPKAKPTQAPRVKAAPATKDKRSMMPIAIGIIFLALVAGGYFAYTKLASRSSYDASATEAAFAQAQILAKRGQFDQAIAVLSAIKPGDPQHDRALEMIADLKNKKSSAGGLIDGRPAAEVFRDLVAAAKAAYESHDYLAAKQAFERAASIQQLPPDAVPVYQDAMQQVAKLDAARALFKEGRYADAITNLQALLQQDPMNPNIRQLVSDAHFDLGRTALAEERTKDAAAEFEQVIANNPSDELAKRSRELALRYDGETKDLLYRIYVKYLPLR